MTWPLAVGTACAIALTVWVIGLLPSARVKAFAYSFPIPITMATLAAQSPPTSDQVFGVALLVSFFFAVAFGTERLRLRLRPTVVAATVLYALVAAALRALPEAPFAPSLAAVTSLWLALAWWVLARGHTRTPRQPADPTPFRLGPQIARLAAVGAVACTFVFSIPLLGGFAVTFPYSGVLVAWELKADRFEFAQRFLVNSVALLAFFAALRYSGSLVAAWAAFLPASLLAGGAQAVAARRRANRPTTPGGQQP
ncbi:MAG: hypothetical protein LBJ08_10485 [Bifidobacteriaceae bacterium]|nr:hypothetical protein [Bifidobacteriaceae bacterium]